MTICAGLSCLATTARAHASIVDEKIEPISLLRDDLRELSDLRQAGKIGHHELRVAAAFLDLADNLRAPVSVPAMHQNPGAHFPEPLRNHPTNAVRRASDERGRSRQFLHSETPP